MKTTLTIKKTEVLQEIAKTTAYIGSKLVDTDASAYDRILTTDEDAQMLERYWQECKNVIAGSLRRFIDSETETDGIYTLTLNLSSAWDAALEDSMQRSLFSFFVMSIASKWQMMTNKGDVNDYATTAVAALEDVRQKACYKKRPTRPTY